MREPLGQSAKKLPTNTNTNKNANSNLDVALIGSLALLGLLGAYAVKRYSQAKVKSKKRRYIR